MNSDAVRRRLITIDHSVIAYNIRDTQPIVCEDARSPLGLRGAMRNCVSPRMNSFLIPKE